jgi:hypothetical protein
LGCSPNTGVSSQDCVDGIFKLVLIVSMMESVDYLDEYLDLRILLLSSKTLRLFISVLHAKAGMFGLTFQ